MSEVVAFCFNDPKEALVQVAMRYSAEDSDDDARYYESSKESLEEYRVLDLSQSWLLDPHLTVEYLSDDVTLLIARYPWFVLEGVSRSRVKGIIRRERLLILG